MVFDELPVSAAEGCIFAHFICLQCRRPRKGMTLSKDHIEELTRAGITHINTARLQESDIAEDAAVVALAEALCLILIRPACVWMRFSRDGSI